MVVGDSLLVTQEATRIFEVTRLCLNVDSVRQVLSDAIGCYM